ncbi:MAG: Uma2 family endonuclease [Planctomycetota bacterium]
MKAIAFRSCDRFSQAEFAAWLRTLPPDDLHHYELLDGRIVMEPPAAWRHGETEAIVVCMLRSFVSERRLGRVFGSSPGFELPTGDTVEPDASFVSRERWEAQDRVPRGFARVVPDLVVEILSPTTRKKDHGQKKRIYERSGVREYWLVDPQSQHVTRFVAAKRGFDRGTVFESGATLGSVVLEGLRIAVAELFPEP